MSCDHVAQYKKRHGVDAYDFLHKFFVACIAKDSFLKKGRQCVCMQQSCKTKYVRVHACLSCVYFGCFFNKHIHAHHENIKEHNLAFETNYGHVYCFDCGDYQYDADFEKIAEKQQLIAVNQRGVNLKWKPSLIDVALLKDHHLVNVSKIGLRGILNMGKTCYINSILQSLVHAPLFRDYFLTLQHKCEFQSSKSLERSPELETPVCFACEMSNIVQEFFSGKQDPIIPHRLLYLLWIQGAVLRGYKEQDAHEFLTFLLDNLHANCKSSNGNTGTDHRCECIIDTIFTGYSNDIYKCLKCSYQFSRNNLFKHLVLPFDTADSSQNPSLADCLERSMVSVVNELTCIKCQDIKSFSVKTTLQKLPLIFSFHVNQKTENKSVKKGKNVKKEKKAKESSKRFIKFPEFLDISPFLFSQSNVGNDGHTQHSFNGCSVSESSVNGNSNIFYLFAVVEHTGNEESGHYVSYVRHHKNKWFHCNDDTVQEIPLESVLTKKAYLLFYHKKFLEYEIKSGQDEKKVFT